MHCFHEIDHFIYQCSYNKWSYFILINEERFQLTNKRFKFSDFTFDSFREFQKNVHSALSAYTNDKEFDYDSNSLHLFSAIKKLVSNLDWVQHNIFSPDKRRKTLHHATEFNNSLYIITVFPDIKVSDGGFISSCDFQDYFSHIIPASWQSKLKNDCKAVFKCIDLTVPILAEWVKVNSTIHMFCFLFSSLKF